jgi:hypothetical protein
MDNQIIPLASPTITWNTVPGAAIYRLRIRQGFMDMNFFSQFTSGTCLVGGIRSAWRPSTT